MPNCTRNSTTALFADDSKCFRSIHSTYDCLLLQDDINSLYEWGKTWDMHYHPSKCKILSVTRKRNMVKFDYHMNNNILSRTDSIKDLGIDISSSLVWNDHVKRVVNKCNKKLGMIKRAIGFNAPERVTKTLFTALVRSDVEYASSLWSGTSKRNLRLIEGIQRRATNYTLHYPDLDYRERLTKLNLLPLSFRREILDLTFFFRCKMELYDLNLNHFVVFNSTLKDRPITRSSADPLLLIPKRCKTESHRASFFNRIVPLWNQLPLTIRSTVNMSSFKSQLSEWYKNKLEESFDPYNTCSWVTCCQCSGCRLV